MSDRVRIAINAGVSIIFVAIVFLSVRGIGRAIDRRLEDTRQKLEALREREARHAIAVAVQSDYKEIKPFLPAFYSALPGAHDILLFSDSVEERARSTGNQITFQFDPEEPAADSTYPDVASVKFRAELKGSEETFTRFLREFRNARSFAVIRQIAISGETEIRGASTMTLRGQAFIKK